MYSCHEAARQSYLIYTKATVHKSILGLTLRVMRLPEIATDILVQNDCDLGSVGGTMREKAARRDSVNDCNSIR
jgi:hypothetical protein